MKTLIISAGILLTAIQYAPAQQVVVGTGADRSSIYLTDVNGVAIPAKTSGEVSGSPFLYDNWYIGNVLFVNGKRADSMPLKMDLENNRVLFQRDGNTMSFVDPVKEFSFVFDQMGIRKDVIYRNGYPAVNDHTNTSLYQVLTDGPRFQLLQYNKRLYKESYVYGGPPKAEYTDITDFYIYDATAGTMRRVKLNKSSVKNALPGMEKAVDDLGSKNHWSLKNLDELKLLVNELNR